MRKLKVGFLQQHNTADNKSNVVRLAEGIADLAKREAQLIVLQELHNSLYFCQVEDVNNFDQYALCHTESPSYGIRAGHQHGIVEHASLFLQITSVRCKS